MHQVTGYHGYWPVKGREVDARWGGDAALKAMVAEAHKHGIRVLQDWVIHHVHQAHEYIPLHPSWFNSTGCVCGTSNCDWTAHALDCVFTTYLPNIDHTNPDADAAFVSDGVYWLDTFDLDGFRIDAVKQVPEVATRNLAAEVREDFEKGGTHYFLMGETAMGWSDCADPCNDLNYDTISHYIGPLGLDGQIDFVLYYAASTTAFAYGDQGDDPRRLLVQPRPAKVAGRRDHDALHRQPGHAALHHAGRLPRAGRGPRPRHPLEPVGQHRGGAGAERRGALPPRADRAGLAPGPAGGAAHLLRRRVRAVRRRRSQATASCGGQSPR